MIRVISKKALGFRNLDDNSVVSVRPLVLTELPDWVTKDPMYRWATLDGTLEVMAPEPMTIVPEEPPVVTTGERPIESMEVSELKELAKERGVEIPRSAKKADLIELLKGE